MTEQNTLFGVDPEHRGPDRKKAPKPKHIGLYIADPGTGPKDETCGSCSNITFERQGARKHVPKCSLTRHLWHEPGPSEILPVAPACYRWGKKETAA